MAHDDSLNGSCMSNKNAPKYRYTCGPGAVALAAETQYITSRENNSRLFGLVIISNVIASGFTLISLGMRVGQARTELNVPLPTMYAPGDSEEAKKFNSIQRGHQNALETYPIFLGLSFVSGVRFPVFTAALGALYSMARLRWANHYAETGADTRYSSWLARRVWTPLICMRLATLYFALELLAGKSVLLH